MLRRLGFGATGPQIDAVAAADLSRHLDTVLQSDPAADPGARATPRPSPALPPQPREGAGTAELEAFSSQLADQMDELVLWWVRRMAAVREPAHEKLTLLWHNHFATSANKVPVAEWMGAQNETLRTLKLGDFRTLAQAMLGDAAMLYWLDGVTNSAKAANENLSREFMELFTLGHGSGYTEVDVREGARALTGWSIALGGVTGVDYTQHDGGSKTVLGRVGNLDHSEFCDAVLSHPASSAFVATRLWRALASDDPPSAPTLDRLVAAYGPGRDLRALTKAILIDPEFAAAAGTFVSTPVDWLLGVVRTLQVPIETPGMPAALLAVLTAMGQRPFYPPDVDGWPRGQAWLSTTATSARVWVSRKCTELGDVSMVAEAPRGDRIDAAGYLIGVGAWSDSTAAALADVADDPRRLVAAAVNSPEYLTV